MSIQQRLLRSRYRRQPDAVQSAFFRWLNWLLKDSSWRAYMRQKIRENELPVIEFRPERKKHAKR